MRHAPFSMRRHCQTLTDRLQFASAALMRIPGLATTRSFALTTKLAPYDSPRLL
jgi:hypothetical protein